MELSQELQEQENDWQAFPYFWEPRSTKKVMAFEGNHEHVIVHHDSDCESFYSLEEVIEHYPEVWKECVEYWEDIYSESELKDSKFYSFLEDHDDFTLHYERDDEVSEHNFSLFKSDVKGFINGNKHHLGKNLHTYARTVFRMSKMESLIEAIYRLNKSVPKENINHEALRFVHKEES
jgi:hypothetical protein